MDFNQDYPKSRLPDLTISLWNEVPLDKTSQTVMIELCFLGKLEY